MVFRSIELNNIASKPVIATFFMHFELKGDTYAVLTTHKMNNGNMTGNIFGFR